MARSAQAARRSPVDLLRVESVGGALLVLAAAAAVGIANTPIATDYAALRDWRLGPRALDLHLSVGEWTADGLLAIFFFLAGLELKREFVLGELRDRRRAVIPVVAAVGGIAAPAVVYAVVNIGNPGAESGWAVPTATDIAFALAVLAIIGRGLSTMLRTFLLTLAVVDDLLAITIIAIFYTHHLRIWWLLLALVLIAAFAALLRWHGRLARTRVPVLLALAFAAWGMMHASGVHATVAGVLLGLTIPMVRGEKPSEQPVLAGKLDHLLRPISAGIAVPLFAFFAAGVTVGGLSGLAAALEDRVTLGIVAALVVGKTAGIFFTTVIASAVVKSSMMRAISVRELLGLAVLGGIGFTVSLLIGQLAFASDAARLADAQIGVLVASVLASLLGLAILGSPRRHQRTHVHSAERSG